MTRIYRNAAGCIAWLALLLLLSELPAQPAAIPSNASIVKVTLPPNARLTINDVATQLTGAERIFQTPILEPGRKYEYVLKATWEENGKAVSRERKVEFEVGKLVNVDLSAPDAIATANPQQPAPTATPKVRDFNFTYRATVTGLEPGKKARIWLPVPPSNGDQEIQLLSEDAGGATSQVAKEPKYGNQIYYAELTAKPDGMASVTLVYHVKRKEVKGQSNEQDANVAMFLKPDALVPIGGKPTNSLLQGKELPMGQMPVARALYDIVNTHMKYSKEGTGWGRGDAEWACDSKFGNCSDFHSLFISLARTKNIPAKFEMGFPLPEKRGKGDVAGYHCWAFFKPEGKGWIPVDISEANKNPNMADYYFGNLTENRVAFTIGRDLELVPKQDGPALNFLIYPYVEVDGKPYNGDKVKRQFTFEDVAAK